MSVTCHISEMLAVGISTNIVVIGGLTITRTSSSCSNKSSANDTTEFVGARRLKASPAGRRCDDVQQTNEDGSDVAVAQELALHYMYFPLFSETENTGWPKK